MRQAFLAQGNRLRAIVLARQLGGNASSASGDETSAANPGSIAISAEQPVSIKAVSGRIVGAVGCASGKRRQDAEHPADSFTSIKALSVLLEAQGDESSSAELGRLRAAVSVFAQKPNPKQGDVRRV